MTTLQSNYRAEGISSALPWCEHSYNLINMQQQSKIGIRRSGKPKKGDSCRTGHNMREKVVYCATIGSGDDQS